jgi:DNA-directed RNA polymerase subunit RPC12/RpoP
MPREAERAALVCVNCGSNRSLEVEVSGSPTQGVTLVRCRGCGERFSADVDPEKISCPVCSGRLLPSGSSYIGSTTFSISTRCHSCGTQVRYSGIKTDAGALVTAG